MAKSSSFPKSCQVLVVEDVEVMLGVIRLIVAGIPGVTVSGIARNTWEARLEISRRKPNVVLLDEILPGESGLDLLKELEDQELAVILMTSIKKPSHALPAGAIARVVKPGWETLEKDRARFEEQVAAAIWKAYALSK